MASSLSEVRAKKKSAFSCEACRLRKVKCTGEQPRCGKCVTRDDKCEYRLPPTLSYTNKLEARIEHLENLLSRAPTFTTLDSVPTQESSQVLKQLTGTSSTLIENEAETNFDVLRRDARGEITYHSPISVFQPQGTARLGMEYVAAERTLPLSPPSDSQRRERLVQNAWKQRGLEGLAETPEPFQYLLNFHWCWIQPLFNFIYRPAFTRDMYNLGPYYSHGLLNAVLAHSVRWCRDEPFVRAMLQSYESGALFARHARTLLFDEISQGRCRVPTVQTLLLLSAQECGAGHRTQAWMYSGMAFRLVEDMGICVNSQEYASALELSDEDIEIRNRLFWSCYIWDKLISLYLGRSPTVQCSTISPPRVILDDSAESDVWKPFGNTSFSNTQYPDTPARSTSCLMQMCSLSVIFNQILLHMYSPQRRNTKTEVQTCQQVQGNELRNWWRDLPAFLKIHVTDLPLQAPPSHIVTLNCLYHTFNILLHRPMLFVSTSKDSTTPEAEHLKECHISAVSIIAIFGLFHRTFGGSPVILSLAYSIYTAASIFLLELQAGVNDDGYTTERMTFCVRALNSFKSSLPVIRDAVDLISKSLNDSNITLQPSLVVRSPKVGSIDNGGGPVAAGNFTTLNMTSMIPALSSDECHFQSPFSGFDLQIEVNLNNLDHFSTLEPISTTVGVLDII